MKRTIEITIEAHQGKPGYYTWEELQDGRAIHRRYADGPRRYDEYLRWLGELARRGYVEYGYPQPCRGFGASNCRRTFELQEERP